MAIRKLPPVEYLRQVFDYNAGTGDLIWKKREDVPEKWNTRFAGKIAGSVHIKGYLSVAVNGRAYLAHRIAWAMYYGTAPDLQIDHVDLNKTNNRIANLRQVTNSENKMNEKARSNNKLGIKGVYFSKKDNRFKAELKVNGKRVLCSYHKTAEDAKIAYQRAAIMYHGEFARTK